MTAKHEAPSANDYEAAISDLIEMSKQYSGFEFNMRLNNMVMLRFPILAKRLQLTHLASKR